MENELGAISDFFPFRHDVSDPKSLPLSPELLPVTLRQWCTWTTDFPADYITEFTQLCGTLIAKCDDASKIVFVGRSPELLYEYIRACYGNTDYESRFAVFLFSCRISGFKDYVDWKHYAPLSRMKLRPYMRALGIAPNDIIRRKRPTAFVDYVHLGTTMNCLFYLLAEWCIEENLDFRGMISKLRIISIERTEAREQSWDTYGADPLCENEWIRNLGTRRVRRIWIPHNTWCSFAETTAKSCSSYTSEKWGTEGMVEMTEDRYFGLLFCRIHYNYGASREGRAALRRAIGTQAEIRWTWLREWLGMLRDGAATCAQAGHSRARPKAKSRKVAPRSDYRAFRETDEKWIRSIEERVSRKHGREDGKSGKHEFRKDIRQQLQEVSQELDEPN